MLLSLPRGSERRPVAAPKPSDRHAKRRLWARPWSPGRCAGAGV